MSSRRPFRLGLLLVALLAGLAACGVPAEEGPRVIAPTADNALPTAAPTPLGPAGGAEVTFCLTRDEQLVEVTRRVTRVPDVGDSIEDLLAGPTEEESALGLGTALGGAPVVTDVRLDDSVAVLTLRSDAREGSRTDDVLALGQVVCTLTARKDVTGVAFEQDGERVAVPRGDGSLTREPLRIGDFEVLRPPG